MDPLGFHSSSDSPPEFLMHHGVMGLGLRVEGLSSPEHGKRSRLKGVQGLGFRSIERHFDKHEAHNSC